MDWKTLFGYLGTVCLVLSTACFLIGKGIWQNFFQWPKYLRKEKLIRMLEGKSGRLYSLYGIILFFIGFLFLIISFIL
jgi:hypothetical protein